jgi:nitric oxide dioxygenase
MRLTDDEADLVRASFRDLALRQETASLVFYDRLFAIAPSLRPLFPADMGEQGTKMMSMLGIVVSQIHDLEALAPVVRDLARRHVGYGARPAHYPLVGEALLWTLARGLGEDFTPAARAAWEKAYGALVATMLEAAGG